MHVHHLGLYCILFRTHFNLQINVALQLTMLKKVTTTTSWWRGTVVERRSLTGELSLSCARPAADG